MHLFFLHGNQFLLTTCLVSVISKIVVPAAKTTVKRLFQVFLCQFLPSPFLPEIIDQFLGESEGFLGRVPTWLLGSFMLQAQN